MSYSSGAGGLPVDNCSIGFVDYNDLATVTTPISVTGGTPVYLTNDGLGAFTNKAYLPQGVTDVWDASINSFDFTELKVGDMLDIRLEVDITTTAPNQEVLIDLELAQGGSTYTIPFSDVTQKTTGLHRLNRFNGIYMGDTNTLDNPAKFKLSSPDNCSVTVLGWYCKILIKG